MKNRTFSTIVIVLLFTLAFLCCFRACASAVEGNLDGGNAEVAEKTKETENASSASTDEDSEKTDLKTYVEERIVPVISGVGAAILAIFVALGPLISAFNAMKNAVASFSKRDEERNASVKESNRLMQKNIERIESNVADVPKLQAQVRMLERQADEMKLVCVTLAKITALGFQANADVVRSGKGKKMAVMLKKLSSTVGDVEGEFHEIETTETIPQSSVATAPFEQRSPEVMENDEAEV